ncbi:hypothetical protein GYA19_00210, partial [Candidatus Beckwithbacteria bacterium]|nr:hypothetical protein [Candidatus Beckwithbacteria bacterium]
VDGDLYLSGNLFAHKIQTNQLTTNSLEAQTATISGSLFASLIQNQNGEDISLILKNKTTTNSTSLASKFSIQNVDKEVASIDSTGKAEFTDVTTNKINLNTEEDELNNITSSIGVGTIIAGETSVDIQTPAVTEGSLIFVTATTATDIPLAVTAKKAGESFTVSISSVNLENIQFNWWIIN